MPGEDPESSTRVALEPLLRLVRLAFDHGSRTGAAIDMVQGTALFHPGRDRLIKQLPVFGEAAASLASDQRVIERCDSRQSERLALQFVYEVGQLHTGFPLNEAHVDNVWERLNQELDDPWWNYRAVANIRNFESASSPVEVTDGVSLRRRSSEELGGMGFADFILERLEEDSREWGLSEFVIVLENSERKEPANILNPVSPALVTNAWRAMGALRLLRPGAVGLGALWHARASRFNPGIGGYSSTGGPPGFFGPSYAYTSGLRDDVVNLYKRLRFLEEDGYARAPGNLDLALRSFMSTYDRPLRADSELIDSVTALEAILALGEQSELAFKLAFRVAGLLGRDDSGRAALFSDVKRFYDARSRLVHGNKLKPQHHEMISRVEELRELVRNVLRGFVILASTEGVNRFGAEQLRQSLDVILLQATEREELRRAMHMIP